MIKKVLEKLGLKKREESNLERHSRRELELAGWFDKKGAYGGMMGHAVMDLVKTFAGEGHSGMSASLAVNLFKQVASFEPLTPLTGEDEEWDDLGDGMYQNNRCSHVFRKGGEVYDINGRVFCEPNGACFTSLDSRVPVTFPYTPSTEYIDVPL